MNESEQEIEQLVSGQLAAIGIKEENKKGKKVAEKQEEKAHEDLHDMVAAPEESEPLSEHEQAMKDKGWSPGGPLTAKECERAQPLYDEIKARGKQVKQLQKTVDRMNAMMEKQEQEAYDKALATLRQEKANAIQAGDVKRVEAVEAQQAKMAPVKKGLHPALESFQ